MIIHWSRLRRFVGVIFGFQLWPGSVAQGTGKMIIHTTCKYRKNYLHFWLLNFKNGMFQMKIWTNLSKFSMNNCWTRQTNSPWSDCSSRSSLIGDYFVCTCFFCLSILALALQAAHNDFISILQWETKTSIFVQNKYLCRVHAMIVKYNGSVYCIDVEIHSCKQEE